MSSSLVGRVGVVLAGLLFVTACGEDRYQVRMGPAEALEGAAAYDLVLLRVTCQQLQEAGGIADRGWVLRRSQWQPGQTPPDLGEVEPGRYALVGIVRGADCGAGWAGCLDIELVRGGGETLDVTLQAFGGAGCLPNEICAGGGICTERPQCDNVSVACDNDGDGYLACAEGLTPPPCDCWDEGAEVHPGAEEHCDGFDNDCNGEDDPPECAACFDTCPEMGECERGDCPDGPDGQCVVVDRLDGRDCLGESGPAFCCGGVCDGECAPAATEPQDCGVAGTQTRTCGADCSWGDWSTCEEPGDCTDGATRVDQPCGNCLLGLGDEICEGGAWVADGPCVGGGVCSPGATAPTTCPECGVGENTCLPDCTWEIGPCEPDVGDPCVDPEVCCPNGSCGEGTECCGTDVSTCGPAPLCRDWACDLGMCTEVQEAAGTDPEDECGALCCNGAGACAAC